MKIYINLEKSGSVYYLEDGALMQVPIGSDNIADLKEKAEVDFESIDKKDQIECRKIKAKLSA